MSSTEDYLPLGLMLVNGGQLNGKRLLSPRTVEMMASPHAPDSLPGRTPGQSFGLSVRLVSDHVKAAHAFGWTLLEMDEGLVDEAWLRVKPKWGAYAGLPVSFAMVWQR